MTTIAEQATAEFADPVFYVPACNGVVPQIIDTARPYRGSYIGQYSGRTLEEFRVNYPTAKIGDLDTVVQEKECLLISAPVEITEDAFIEALEVLPPEDYQTGRSAVTFKMCEHLSGRITAVYAHVGSRYFTFNDVCSIEHAQIVDKVKRSLEIERAAT